MGAFDKFKNGIHKFINVTEDGYEDNYAADNYNDYGSQYQDSSDSEYEAIENELRNVTGKSRAAKPAKHTNVVQMDNNRQGTLRSVSDTQVVVKKVSDVNEVGNVADVLKQRKIVVLNLEDCPNEALQRVRDILYGVTYALDGSFNAIAEKAFVITPDNVSVASEDYSELTDNY